MTRSSLPIFLVVCVLLSSCTIEDVDTPPNIVIFLADDQGWGDLSSSGNTNLNTPNIDRLAEQGASFTHFYVSPVCSPTRAELLTGRYHPRGGVYATSAGGERLDLDETTIAEVLKNAGYSTGAFGKWHNGMQPPYHPNTRGFDEFYGFASGHWGNYFSPMLEHNGAIVQGTGYVIDDFTGKAIEFIKSNQDQPFFVYLPYNTPHSPMQVPDEWWEKFENKELELGPQNPERQNLQHTRAALAMVENIDWNVGRVLETLSTLSLEENTIVIYLTDNGPNGHRWNGGMKGIKGSTDEGGVRSPFYIQWKEHITPGQKITEIASVIDLLPTLADMANIEYTTNKPLDGVSLSPLFKPEVSNWPERYLFSYWRDRVSVRSQQYRLDHQNNLFDMEADPGQSTNIALQEPDIHQQLVEARQKWENTVLSELSIEKRPITVGYPGFEYNQMPARDATTTGNIERSNRYPNDSFFRNWTSTEETITWDVDVLEDGEFEVILYYTCSEENIGSTIELTMGPHTLEGVVEHAYESEIMGMEHDRVERQESYVQNFRPQSLGTIQLTKGQGLLSLKATEIPGSEVMDFRLMILRRTDQVLSE